MESALVRQLENAQSQTNERLQRLVALQKRLGGTATSQPRA